MKLVASFVIPIYNSSSYIAETLTSVEKACVSFPYEVILVDDCSEDVKDIKSIIESLDNIKLIQKVHKTNAADSRNIGYKESKGRFVFFLDSDDKILPNSVERRINLHKEKASGVVFGNYILQFQDRSKEMNLPEYCNENMRDYLFSKVGDFRSSTISIDKNYFRGTLFDSKSLKHQDWIYAIRCYDDKENILFDPEFTTIITTNINNSRMSTSYNFSASDYLCKQYLKDTKYINNFSKKHWKKTILESDKEACSFFLGMYKPTNLREFTSYTIYKISSSPALLPLSSHLARLLKRLVKR